MRRRWKVVLGAGAAVLIGGGLVGWWYADRTVIARMAERDGIDALQAGDRGRAEERFSAAIRKFPSDTDRSARAHLWRSQVRLARGAFEEAHADADQAVHIQSANATAARTLRARAAYKLGRYDEAKADYDQVLEAKPDSAAVHFYLGLIAERRGDLDGATQHYYRTCDLDRPSVAKQWLTSAFAGLSRILRARGDAEMADFMRDSALQLNPQQSFEIE
jgi:tetratricopeptide (TPR) repeat protein